MFKSTSKHLNTTNSNCYKRTH